MKLTFFLPKPKGAVPAPPSVSVRRKGQHSLNNAAAEMIGAEPGEAATICYDEEGDRWLLAHWPGGHDGHPQLHALTSKNAKGLRFSCIAVAEPLFANLSAELNTFTYELDKTALTSEEAPGATLYELHPVAGVTATRVTPKQATVKQPGVGRGRYARKTIHQQAMGSHA